MVDGMRIRSATIWSGALQAAASVVGHLKGDALWGSSATDRASNTARAIVELAAHIIVQMPEDPESGVSQARHFAEQWLKSTGQ